MALGRFYFEKRPSYGWDGAETIDIEYQGERIGYLEGKDGEGWEAYIHIPATRRDLAKNPRCPWAWGQINERFDTAYIAKAWFNQNKAMVIRNLYLEEN